MSGNNPRRWTPAEDLILRNYVDAQEAQGGSRDWCQIASALPGRSNKDCRKRWHNSVAEGLKKGQWSKSEDELLTRGVQCYGHQWTKVATCVSSRSADQCAKRWQQSLDPHLDRSEWRQHEDTALLSAVESLGRHWKDIQEQYLPHRSKNCVKNRYSVLTRRNTTRLTPYDDSIGSSSSDAGTPMHMDGDLPLDFMATSLLQNAAHGMYPQTQIPHTSITDMSWPSPGISNPSMTLPTDHVDHFEGSSWPVSTDRFPIQPVASIQGQWGYVQASTDLHQPMQYPRTAHPYMHAYTYPAQQQPPMTTSVSYGPPSLHLSHLQAPIGEPSRLSRRGGYGQPYRGG